MKRGQILISLMFMLLIPSALAQVAITEIMYAPNQTNSETDAEWVELYNGGSASVNLTGWMINDNVFDPSTLNSQEHLVIARELTDGTDTDTDSFQSVWGTSINAVDGSFTLSNSGSTVVLKNPVGEIVDSVTYTSEFGLKNGKSVELIEGFWVESLVYGGTPGSGEVVSVGGLEAEVVITLDLQNSIPEIVSASYDATKLYATVYDANGLDEIQEVYVEILDEVLYMIQEATTYKVGLPELLPGEYDAMIYARDLESTGNTTLKIIIETLASLNVLQDILPFTEMKAGESKNTTLEIENNGNVDLQIDFEIIGDALLQEGLDCFNGNWQNATTCSLTVPAGEIQSLDLRLTVPEGTKSGQYSAKLQTTATVL